METSTAADEILQLVTFTLENQEYAVDILKVQEINRLTEITKVPNPAPYIEGVINLRGKVVPVINIRKKLGFSEKDIDENSRVIIIDIPGNTRGIIVDAVSEILSIPSNIVEPMPPMAPNMDRSFIRGIAKLENRLVILTDIDTLIGVDV